MHVPRPRHRAQKDEAILYLHSAHALLPAPVSSLTRSLGPSAPRRSGSSSSSWGGKLFSSLATSILMKVLQNLQVSPHQHQDACTADDLGRVGSEDMARGGLILCASVLPRCWWRWMAAQVEITDVSVVLHEEGDERRDLHSSLLLPEDEEDDDRDVLEDSHLGSSRRTGSPLTDDSTVSTHPPTACHIVPWRAGGVAGWGGGVETASGAGRGGKVVHPSATYYLSQGRHMSHALTAYCSCLQDGGPSSSVHFAVGLHFESIVLQPTRPATSTAIVASPTGLALVTEAVTEGLRGLVTDPPVMIMRLDVVGAGAGSGSAGGGSGSAPPRTPPARPPTLSKVRAPRMAFIIVVRECVRG